jgi:crotonobetaine/carnitine-CoA ligase
MPAYMAKWQERFGVEHIFSFYNMSEISSPLQTGSNPRNLKSVGTVRPGAQVRIVDENDLELPPGAVGELIVRIDAPWEMSLGYLGNPGATAEAWRNGWFHTGDAFVRDANGHYYFVDRMKDCIRRRGENISSFDVEREILLHPDVLECAVVAIVVEAGDDPEVRALVVPKPGAAVDPADLARRLEERLPKFMRPRFIEVVGALPRNPTGKILKRDLRQQPLGVAAWDRLAGASPATGPTSPKGPSDG